jgi:hypothetical protein
VGAEKSDKGFGRAI